MTEKRQKQMRPLEMAWWQTHSNAASGIAVELKSTLVLAMPLALGNLGQIAMAVTNTIMVGHLGATPLAAAGLGAMIYFTGGAVLQGVLSAVAPLVAHALGGEDHATAGRIAGTAFLIAALLALPFTTALMGLDRLLPMLGYDAPLATEIGRFLRAVAWGAPAFLGFAVLRGLLTALSRTRTVMAVLLMSVAGNAGLNWVLIYGHLGAPPLGAAGSGYATAINQWLLLAGLALCFRVLPDRTGLRVLRGSLSPSWTETANILRVGLPIGGIMGMELGVFLAAGIMIGLFGASALAAHQLILNCVGITFMVPLGLSQATTVRVAGELGAGRTFAARRAGFAALAIGVGFMTASAIVLWNFPQEILSIYVDIRQPANHRLVEIARRLLTIAALFQVFDGMQTIAAGALRGYKDTMVPMLLASLAYWGAGFGGGWLLAFPLGYGAVGVWGGLAFGLAAAAIVLTLRLHFRAPAKHWDAKVVAAP